MAEKHSGFEGLGNIDLATNTKAIILGSITVSAVGPTDNVDVTGVHIVWIDTSSNAVIIGGFTGGVNGQVLFVVKADAAANNATLEHNEVHAFQEILLHRGSDETLFTEYGGWILICDGTSWFDVSHAKHV